VKMDEVGFRATVESARGGGHVVEVDAGFAAVIGGKHGTRVRGTLAGADYRSNLVSMGGRLLLGVHNATLRAAGVSAGDRVDVTIAPDGEPLPNDEVPDILAEALARDAAAASAWEALSPSHRREHVGAIVEAKRDETRERRVRRTIEQLREGAAGP
jgi:bacteriocin resistance YdeI/OmpD-like protein/uncharacterized protein DUF1905